MRQTLTGSDVIPASPNDPYLDKMMMDMEAMSGSELDMMFLKSMIGHHSEAISIAERALDNLSRTDMKANAEAVISDQAREIGEMQALRSTTRFRMTNRLIRTSLQQRGQQGVIPCGHWGGGV